MLGGLALVCPKEGRQVAKKQTPKYAIEAVDERIEVRRVAD